MVLFHPSPILGRVINIMDYTLSNAPNPAKTTWQASTPMDDLVRVFNTALISTRASENREQSSELHRLMECPAFRAILSSIRQHARLQGISEREAAEEIILAFRKVDQIWNNYVFQEGVNRLKSSS